MKTRMKIVGIIAALMAAGVLSACGTSANKNVESDSVATSDVSVAVSTDTAADSDASSAADTSSAASESSKASSATDVSSANSAASKTSKTSASSKTSKTSTASKTSSANTAVSSAAKSVSSKSESKVEKHDDTQNPVMNFVGLYVCERARMNVKAKGDNEAEITINWSSSFNTYTSWKMSGVFDTDTLTVSYSNCTETNIEVNSDGSIADSELVYENGEGRIVFHDDNTVTWEDDEENAAYGMIFTYNAYEDDDYYSNTSSKETSTDSDEELYADITKTDALGKVRTQAGSGAQILDVSQGYTSDGDEAWVITVAPVTTEEGPESVTYYVGSLFCYSDDNDSADSDDNELSSDVTDE